ncbi:MAG: hypothetical protein EB034_10775 [Verrucomicrobia bacterium]|nr:hypothetical protein [Verrucomicrobiota bacterium]
MNPALSSEPNSEFPSIALSSDSNASFFRFSFGESGVAGSSSLSINSRNSFTERSLLIKLVRA